MRNGFYGSALRMAVSMTAVSILAAQHHKAEPAPPPRPPRKAMPPKLEAEVLRVLGVKPSRSPAAGDEARMARAEAKRERKRMRRLRP